LIRVGFVVDKGGHGWLGGSNYIRNLLHAICSLPDRRIEPVIFVPPKAPDSLLDGLPVTEVVRTPLISPTGIVRAVRKRIEQAIGCDIAKECILRANHIAILSHAGHLGSRSSISTIGWLADFQHRRMPEFFDAREIAARDRSFRRTVDYCSRVLVSSFDAQADLANFAPGAVEKCRVLHFVSGFKGLADEPDEATLRARFKIDGSYFHLPNQYWAHKNHRVAIDALAILTSKRRSVTIVSTGHAHDQRHPEHFGNLMHHVRASGVEDRFRVLGVIPYNDLAGLMKHSIAVINPSLFEGWSTTVEEGKSMGKKIILSDIPVHREQAPARCIYFPPTDAEALANAMWAAQSEYSPRNEALHQAEARDHLPRRMEAFGRQYESVALEICERS